MARILVIEDEPGVRITIATCLRQAGHDVEASAYIATAAGAALSGDYELITLDLNLPDMDGREIASLLHVRNVVTPVLVISGQLDKSNMTELREMGVRHFLPKPFRVADLLRAVEDALAHQGKEG